jgi:hypothetical protein
MDLDKKARVQGRVTDSLKSMTVRTCWSLRTGGNTCEGILSFEASLA